MSLSWLNRWTKKTAQAKQKRPNVRLEVECLEDRCLPSGFQMPVYTPPVYHAPVYQAPVYQAPVYHAPVYQPPQVLTHTVAPTPSFSISASPATHTTPSITTAAPAQSVTTISTTFHPMVAPPTVSFTSAPSPTSASSTVTSSAPVQSVTTISPTFHPIVATPTVSFNIAAASNASLPLLAAPYTNSLVITPNRVTNPGSPTNETQTGTVHFATAPTGSVTLANGTVVSQLGQVLSPNDEARTPSREEMEQIGILLRTAELQQIIRLPNTGPGYNDPTQTSTVNEKLAAQAQLTMLPVTAAAFNPYQGMSQEMIRLGVSKQVDPKVFNWILLNEYSFPAPSVLPAMTASGNLFAPIAPTQAMTPQQSLQNYLNYVKPAFNTDAAQATATPLSQAAVDQLSKAIEQAFTQQAFQAFQDGTGSALDAALRQANPWAVGYAFNTHGSIYAGMANDAISTGAIAQLTPGQWESLLADNGIPVWGHGLQNIGSGDDTVQNIPFVGGTNEASEQPGQPVINFRLKAGQDWLPGGGNNYHDANFVYDINGHVIGAWSGNQAHYFSNVPTPTATDHAPSAPSLMVRTYNLDQPAPANTHYGTEPGVSGSKTVPADAALNNFLQSALQFLHLAPQNVNNMLRAPMAPHNYADTTQTGTNQNQPADNTNNSHIGQGDGTRFNQNAGGQANWQGGGTIDRSQTGGFHSNLP